MKDKKFYKVTPFLPVRNIQETLVYYKHELGFYDEWTWGKDGGIRRDEMRLLFGENPGYLSSINKESYGFELVWFVDNVDDIYKEYQDKKLNIVSELKDEPWGIREFTIKDINGYFIRISETIASKKQ